MPDTDSAKINPIFFKMDIEWIGHESNQNGIRPLLDELMAKKDLKRSYNEKELK